MRDRTDRPLWGMLVLLAVLTAPATAEVVRIEIERREPFAQGRAFGETGPYEKLTGRMHFEVDPHDPAHGAGRLVVDAAMPRVAAAGKGFFNHRFAQITRYGSPHEEHLFPCDFFSFTTVPQVDEVTGKEGDPLERVRAAAASLVREGYLLAEDAERIEAAAAAGPHWN